MTATQNPVSLRRVITCAKNLMTRQGFSRRRAISASLKITRLHPAKGTRAIDVARQEYALEYLHHRNRSMAGVR